MANTLVAYFSATGRTAKVAKLLAEALAEILEIFGAQRGLFFHFGSGEANGLLFARQLIDARYFFFGHTWLLL